MAFPKRVDKNQPEIVAAFRKLGASVLILSMVGKGCPDILVGMYNTNWLVEIKNGENSPSQRKLTVDEQLFFDSWHGQVCIINSVEEAAQLVKKIIETVQC